MVERPSLSTEQIHSIGKYAFDSERRKVELAATLSATDKSQFDEIDATSASATHVQFYADQVNDDEILRHHHPGTQAALSTSNADKTTFDKLGGAHPISIISNQTGEAIIATFSASSHEELSRDGTQAKAVAYSTTGKIRAINDSEELQQYGLVA